MKREEYLSKIKQEGISLRKLDIVVGEKTNAPNSIGCYEENQIWHLYGVNEKQDLVITKSGTEDEIFSYLYLLTEGLYEEYE